MNIKVIAGYDKIDDIAELFSEYTNMLIRDNSSIKEYLQMQNYEEELKDIKYKYGEPFGRVYLAYYNEKLAGCIALRKITKDSCEMKRLYVKDEFRGKNIGSILVEKIIEDAKKIGYKFMYLDTLPSLKSAISLYKKFGFYNIEKYNDNPIELSIYLRLDL